MGKKECFTKVKDNLIFLLYGFSIFFLGPSNLSTLLPKKHVTHRAHMSWVGGVVVVVVVWLITFANNVWSEFPYGFQLSAYF